MSTLEVHKVTAKEPYDGQYGKMYPFTLVGMLDGEVEVVEMSFKDAASAPKVGDKLEGTVEDGKYGKRFRKSQAGGGFAGKSFGRSPEERDEIIRQSSLAQAVAYLAVKAPLMPKAKAEAITTQDVLTAASAFFQWAKTGSLPSKSDTPSPARREQSQAVPYDGPNMHGYDMDEIQAMMGEEPK